MKLYYRHLIRKYKVPLTYSSLLILFILTGFIISIILVFHANEKTTELTLNTLLTYDKKIDMNKYCYSVGAKYMFKFKQGSKDQGYLINIYDNSVHYRKFPHYIIDHYVNVHSNYISY